MDRSGTNLKNPKKFLGQTLKSQGKKEVSPPPVFSFLKVCN